MTALLSVEKMTKTFPVRTGLFQHKGELQALRGVSFDLKKGETLGLVGESGCGKSTLGRCLIRLIEPTGGSIRFDGSDVTKLSQRELKSFRRRMQIIFQDPYGSLNPRMTVRTILEEPLLIHNLHGGTKNRQARIEKLLDLVGLPRQVLNRYPHEFSGGQRQRVGIARALAVEPEFIVCDEPVSALDVSIQAQIVNLLMDLQKELGLTYLFISHDLRVVRHISHRVAVMYLGKIVEIADAVSLFESPCHPYTQALLSSVPSIHSEKRKSRILLMGEPPKPTAPPPGCAFHPRCASRIDECLVKVPELLRVAGAPERCAACLLVQ